MREIWSYPRLRPFFRYLATGEFVTWAEQPVFATWYNLRDLWIGAKGHWELLRRRFAPCSAPIRTQNFHAFPNEEMALSARRLDEDGRDLPSLSFDRGRLTA